LLGWIWPPPVIFPSQGGVLAVCWHVRFTSLHMSSLQALLSSQVGVPPVQLPPWHCWLLVQNSPSSHAVPFGWKASAGHDALEPVQFSATSHGPFAGRHRVPLCLSALGGHVVPEQNAGSSQGPAASRHTVLFPAGSWTHPSVVSHLAVVHTFPSSAQVRGGPGTQVPPLQVSVVVQALPSLQDVPFVAGGLEQVPVGGSQVPATWH
jgi:hypothetical protein